MKKTLIIPSAWKPQNSLFPWVYDLMIPINGKPTINYILENIEKWDINKVIILLNENDEKTKKYLNFFKYKNIELFIDNVKSNSLWETIYLSKKYIKNNENIIIQLWDTLLNNMLDFEKNFILVSEKKVLNPQKWTFINNNFIFFDRPKNYINDTFVISWIYYLKNSKDFFDLLNKNNYNFYFSLEKYFSSISNKKLLNIKKGYYDLWHLDEYYKSKIDFLRIRNFNSLEYDDFKWIITKKSNNKEKLNWEINWFKNLPNDLKNFTPRLVDYKKWDKVEYSLEFYWYSSLADIFLYSNYNNDYLKNILWRIIKYLEYVKKKYNDKNFSLSNFYNIYLDKTYERLDTILEDKFLNSIYNKELLIINWKKYKNINILLNKKKLIHIINKKIYNKSDCTIIHWDLCFSNILFDIHNGIFKLIDPRWNFWDIWIWWDIKYDLAKMRHSIHWKYENIISDLYNLDYDLEKNIFNFEYFNWINTELVDFFDEELIKLWYDMETIKLIEWLLYLTMIPLHKDSKERQIIMYLTAIILFNEIKILWN